MRTCLKLGILFLCIPMITTAGTVNDNPLTMSQVIVNVLEKSPMLKASDYEARAAAARIRQSTLQTPLNLHLEMENFAGTGKYKGLDGIETTLSLAKVLESGKKPQLRGQVSRQEASLLHNELDAKRLDLLSESVRRFIHVAVDQQRLDIAIKKRTLLRRTASIVDQRIKAGRSPVAERRRLAIAKARAAIEVEHAEHELLTSQLKLAMMWGETRTGQLSVQASLFVLDEIDTFEQLELLLENNPDLVKYASAKRLAEARLNLSRAKRRPDIELSGGIRHLSGSDDGAFVLSARIPLGTQTRALPSIEASELMSSREPFRYEQRRLELYASLFEVYQELKHAQTAVETLRQKIIPEAELALRDYENGYRAGRYSLLELTTAQQSLLDARLEMTDAAAKYHYGRVEIERLTGTQMQAGVKQ